MDNMSEDYKSPSANPKKGFSGNFFLFFLMTLLMVMALQNFINSHTANIAFSYQLEHLINLGLIQPEESRKVALNNQLVTFSGVFKDEVTEESKQRFKYLLALNKYHEISSQKQALLEELDILQEGVREASLWFLKLSATPVSVQGYRIVDTIYDSPYRENHVIIREFPEHSMTNMADIEAQFAALKNAENLETNSINEFEQQLKTFIDNVSSPFLGVGSEALKQKIKGASQVVLEASTLENVKSRLDKYQTAIVAIKEVIEELNKLQENSRLNGLRSVRKYKEALQNYRQILAKLEDVQTQLDNARSKVGNVIWYFNNQELSTKQLEKQDPEVFSRWFAQASKEWEQFNVNKGAMFKAPDQPRTIVLEKNFRSEEPSPNYLNYLFTALPVILLIVFLYVIFVKQLKGAGSSAMNFGKSTARLLTDGVKATFSDVAGIDEAKEELEEIVEFLKSPEKFTALGAAIPKGVLCMGPPGTGKTLIARAVAGEANRPFFFMSGSEFVEMFVGVGPSRVRDLFKQAKAKSPCIIFIDEIDAVGRQRGGMGGVGGGHDEREQTLNQLLVEMDGFDPNEGIIIMAATNRPDVLDKALLRPGRFDRRIVINLPDLKGRYEILKLHARKIKLEDNVDLMSVARATPGCSGADLRNVLNEAALLAARRNRVAVTAQDAMDACDKVRFGKERRSLEMDEEEKRTTAYHEAGHTIVALKVEHSDPVEKVTIIPRGMSLGATHFLPTKNRLSYWKAELIDQLAILMGGRCAEEIFVKDISSGAQQDIVQATRLARSMVCEWGMNEVLGIVAYDERDESARYLGGGGYQSKNYSEESARAIDIEVRKITTAAYKRALDIIENERDKLELMTNLLMEFETLDSEDIQKIMKGEWDSEEKRKKMFETKALSTKSESKIESQPSAVIAPNLKTDA
ncbi:MAG: ftsH [Chlamydiales bacterium]|jgi:cell division protease FtsH|nr:ftsH [Chlamydiales bacterium]